MKKANLETCFLLGLCALAMFMALQRAEWVPDDSDIVLRYAQNIWKGEGLCYNQGERVLGSTSVLNPLLIAGMAVPLGGDLILARALLFGLALAGLLVLVHRAIRERGPVPACLAATNVLAIPLLYRTIGLETVVVLFLATTSVAAYRARRYRLLGLSLGVLYLARPDGLVLAAVLLAHFLLFRRREEDLGPNLAWIGGLALAVVLPWLLYAWVHFGTPVPGTLEAKMAQRASGAFRGSFFSGLTKSLDAFDARSLFPPKTLRWLLLPCLLFGLWRGPLRLLVLWGLLLSLAYSLLNPPFYHWYGLPLHFSVALGFGSLVLWLWQGRRGFRRLALALNFTFLFLAFPSPFPTPPSKTYPDYREAARWIRTHTPKDASVAAFEIGILGFRIEGRPVRDLLGLVGPADFQAIAEGDFGWWLSEPLPDLVLFHHPVWKRLEAPVLSDPRFQASYAKAWQSDRLLLFRRR